VREPESPAKLNGLWGSAQQDAAVAPDRNAWSLACTRARADASTLRINLFVRGANGHLLERYWNGSAWIRFDTGLSVAGNAVAVQHGNTFSADASGVRINLFVRRSDGRLMERIWNGSAWTWTDAGRSATADPVVIQRGDDFSTDMNDLLINLFVRGSNGHLLERLWG